MDFINKLARVNARPLVTKMHSNTDWDNVTVIRKAKPAAKDLKSASAVNRALASGNAEITLKGTYLQFN